MLPANRIGKTRMELAAILSEYCGKYVPPAFLERNTADFRNGRNYGWAFSWYIDGLGADHPLSTYGSGITMTDFVKLYRRGWRITSYKEELFLNPPDKA